MISVELRTPIEIKNHRGRFQHKTDFNITVSIGFDGDDISRFRAAESVGKIRASLEALQQVLCSGEVEIRCDGLKTIVEGFFQAWNTSAHAIINHAQLSIRHELKVISALPLQKVEFSVHCKLDKRITKLT